MKAQLALCMKYMPAACMKSLTLTHEGLEFGFAKFQFIEISTQTLGHVCLLPEIRAQKRAVVTDLVTTAPIIAFL